MEHRIQPRHDLDLEVELFHRASSLGTFHTRNITADGLFVEGREMELTERDFIGVTVLFRRARQEIRHALTALVVHRRDEGVGIMFTDFNPQLQYQFGALMLKAG